MLSLIATVVLASCPADAAARAKDRADRLDYGNALTAVAGLEDCTDGSAEELGDAFRWRALASAAVLGDDAAIEAFANAVTVFPAYVLGPSSAAKQKELLEKGRRQAKSRRAAWARVTARSGDELAIEVFDPLGLSRSVSVKWEGGQVDATRRPTGWAAKVPSTVLRATLVVSRPEGVQFTSRELNLPAPPAPPPELTPTVVLAPQPAPLAVTSVEAPVQPEQPRRWWPVFVGVGAAVVVAVAVGVGVGLAVKNAHFDGSLGRFEIPKEAP